MATANDLAESTERLVISTEDITNNDKEEISDDDGPENSDAGVGMGRTHPLENEWSFWYDKRPAQSKRVRGEQDSYESNLREIGNFGTVEDFWRYYNHMVKPSKIETNSNYHFFKKGIKPMWEDPHNAKGGKWVLTLKGDKGLVDVIWENVVLAMVGETLDSEDEVCGAVFSKRKGGDRIAVWNRNRENELAIMNIGRQLKSILGADVSKVQTSYQNHEDSMKSGASYTNPSRYKL
jgi:translation initiation factor 4E